MNAFVNAIRAVSKACGVAAALLVGSAIVVVCQMVVMRYVLKASTIWQTEYVIFALVGATLIVVAMAWLGIAVWRAKLTPA